MINISDVGQYNVSVLDATLRDNIPDAIGISSGPYGTVIHLPDDASASDQNKAQKFFDNWDNFNPSIDKTTMTVGDADPVITYTTGDTEVGFVVLLDGALYASGTEAPAGGTVTLELDEPEAGTYEIFIYRKQANFAIGSVFITVSEA